MSQPDAQLSNEELAILDLLLSEAAPGITEEQAEQMSAEEELAVVWRALDLAVKSMYVLGQGQGFGYGRIPPATGVQPAVQAVPPILSVSEM